jgi:hypothetical protein
MPKIIDAILLKPYNNAHYYLVLDEMPVFTFERTGNRLIAECDGFVECYGYETPGPNWQAFGGRKFELPMKDGTMEQAHGQWWWCQPAETESIGSLTSVGIATLEQLKQCYCFSGGNISTAKLNEWLASNEPSTDYEKYDERRLARKGER